MVAAPLTPPSDSVEDQQVLRLQRLRLALVVYLPCALLLFVVERFGLLPQGFTLAWSAIVAVANLAFLALIKSGANLRFADPSMTMAQMAVAIGAVALVLYHANEVRGALLMLLVVIVIFGVLQLNTRQLLMMGALAATAYAAVIGLLAVNRPAQTDLRVEWFQWIALTATLAVVCPLVGYLSGLRRRLSASLRTIREMAQHDALTGVFNRHHLVETLAREIARCERTSTTFLALMVDIDHFKRINDEHGHLAGDQVLSGVAQAIQASLRRSDYVARYGGEEFVVLLSPVSTPATGVACERLRAGIEQLAIEQPAALRVTVSIGATAYRPGDTQASLLERADAALYRAKSKGRNRVELDLAPPAA